MPWVTGPLTLVLAVDPKGSSELAAVMPSQALRQAQAFQPQSCSVIIVAHNTVLYT